MILDETYDAKIACWNCEKIFDIKVSRGTIVFEHITRNKLVCENCGCNTLKVYAEYKIDKRIMKDLVLHTKIQQQENQPPPDKKHDHFG